MQELLTKSNAEPPPKYSIMIHNLVSWNSGDKERKRLLSAMVHFIAGL